MTNIEYITAAYLIMWGIISLYTIYLLKLKK